MQIFTRSLTANSRPPPVSTASTTAADRRDMVGAGADIGASTGLKADEGVDAGTGPEGRNLLSSPSPNAVDMSARVLLPPLMGVGAVVNVGADAYTKMAKGATKRVQWGANEGGGAREQHKDGDGAHEREGEVCCVDIIHTTSAAAIAIS